jgi:hypothetical protein
VCSNRCHDVGVERAEPPAGYPAGGLEIEPRSDQAIIWIEVALPAEHRGPDVLVVDEGDRRPRRVGSNDPRPLIRSVDVRIEQLEADIELRQPPLSPLTYRNSSLCSFRHNQITTYSGAQSADSSRPVARMPHRHAGTAGLTSHLCVFSPSWALRHGFTVGSSRRRAEKDHRPVRITDQKSSTRRVTGARKPPAHCESRWRFGRLQCRACSDDGRGGRPAYGTAGTEARR